MPALESPAPRYTDVVCPQYGCWARIGQPCKTWRSDHSIGTHRKRRLYYWACVHEAEMRKRRSAAAAPVSLKPARMPWD